MQSALFPKLVFKLLQTMDREAALPRQLAIDPGDSFGRYPGNENLSLADCHNSLCAWHLPLPTCTADSLPGC